MAAGDLWCLFDTDLQGDVLDVVCAQLKEDIANMNSGNSVSLLAKWLPSLHSSSADKRRYAKLICGYIGIQEWDYRRALSALRTKWISWRRRCPQGVGRDQV